MEPVIGDKPSLFSTVGHFGATGFTVLGHPVTPELDARQMGGCRMAAFVPRCHPTKLTGDGGRHQRPLRASAGGQTPPSSPVRPRSRAGGAGRHRTLVNGLGLHPPKSQRQ